MTADIINACSGFIVAGTVCFLLAVLWEVIRD